MKYDVYVVYSSKDAAFVSVLVEVLQQCRYKVWWDKKELLAGSEWKLRITEAIQHSRAILCYLTPSFLGSEWVKREIFGHIHSRPPDQKPKVLYLVSPCFRRRHEKRLLSVLQEYQGVKWKKSGTEFDFAALWEIVCGLDDALGKAVDKGMPDTWENKGRQRLKLNSDLVPLVPMVWCALPYVSVAVVAVIVVGAYAWLPSMFSAITHDQIDSVVTMPPVPVGMSVDRCTVAFLPGDSNADNPCGAGGVQEFRACVATDFLPDSDYARCRPEFDVNPDDGISVHVRADGRFPLALECLNGDVFHGDGSCDSAVGFTLKRR